MMKKDVDTMNKHFKKEALMHLDSLLRAALYMTGDMETANNLIQETYLRAYCLWGQSIVTRGYRTRLFRAMTGLLKEYELSRNSSADYEGSNVINELPTKDMNFPVNMDADKVDEYCHKLDDEVVKDAIRQLPYDLRLMIVLHFIEGFSYQEIAEISEIGIMSVKEHLRNGRLILQEILWRKMVVDGLVKEHSAYS
jgi:RNA polymerase sigma-70 factor (ECF subfamily)